MAQMRSIPVDGTILDLGDDGIVRVDLVSGSGGRIVNIMDSRIRTIVCHIRKDHDPGSCSEFIHNTALYRVKSGIALGEPESSRIDPVMGPVTGSAVISEGGSLLDVRNRTGIDFA